MATLAQRRECERRARALLEDHGLPQPDEVEHGMHCVWLIWREEKVCLEIDIDEPPPGWDSAEEVEPIARAG